MTFYEWWQSDCVPSDSCSRGELAQAAWQAAIAHCVDRLRYEYADRLTRAGKSEVGAWDAADVLEEFVK
jgi:hypothetical protein